MSSIAKRIRVESISLSNRRAFKIIFLLPMPSNSCSTLEVVHFCFLRENLFQQLSQVGDVPLVVTQFIEEFTHGILPFQGEGAIKGTIGRDNPEIRIQYD